ncbi:MAG: DUF3553 domain-containing protein [Rhodobacterales bacterium]|nr:DUF3553 domain-containing protein [Rhodobacterales bacterium]
MLVEAPEHPEWGVGQVQSNVTGRVTMNFPNLGKVVVETSLVMLLPVFDA